MKALAVEIARPNPHKRNILIRRIARAPWWLLAAALLIIAFVLGNADNVIYQEVFRQVRQGIWTTIWISVVAYTIALIFGLILALLRRSTNVIIYQLTTLYVEIVRGIPTLVLVYFIVLALTPQFINFINGFGVWLVDNQLLPNLGQALSALRTRDVDNSARAIAGLAISYSAFISEIFRAGIDSIERGQYDAAMSMGMTRWQTMRLVILPQAMRNVLPPLANDFIAMLKESSLVSVVGVQDITRAGQSFAAATFTFFQAYNVVAATYLVLTLALSMLVKLIEVRLGRGRHIG